VLRFAEYQQLLRAVMDKKVIATVPPRVQAVLRIILESAETVENRLWTKDYHAAMGIANRLGR